jgi:ribosomal protein S18 acetylase RimI-like enzyme
MMTSWNVRPADSADLEPMVRLQVATWRDGYRPWLGDDFCNPAFENHVRARLAGFIENETPFRRTLILENESQQAGFVAFGSANRHPGEVFSMYVEPAFRGRGGGEYLLAQAWIALAARSSTPVQIAVLDFNTGAQRFYKRLGASEFTRDEFDLNGRTLQEVVFVLRSAPSTATR